MGFKETKISGENIYRGKILNLKRDKISLPDGREAYREIVEHHGGVCVLAVTEKGIPFVTQYRYAVGEEVLELPAGKLEKGEAPELCGIRELREETGLLTESLTLLAEIFPSPGYTSERLYLYLCGECAEGERSLDDDEFLTVTYISEKDAEKMLGAGEFKDAKTVIALFKYFKSRK